MKLYPGFKLTLRLYIGTMKTELLTNRKSPQMKRSTLRWLGTGLAFLLLASFAIAQNNDDDKKGRGRDRGQERGQSSRQNDQYPAGRRQSGPQNEPQTRQRERVQERDNRPGQRDSQPVEK